MNKTTQGSYTLVAFGKFLELRQEEENSVWLSCNEDEYDLIWRDYFDLEYDYGRVVKELTTGNDPFLREAAAYGCGIRILKQDFFEMMISYIISQNKNIPAIKSCIEGLCSRYGTPIREEGSERIIAYAFPEPQALANASREELRELKVGYRDEYILRASRAVTIGEIDPKTIRSCSYEEAHKLLKGIHGIGDKVANCICLYGLHHIEVFPVDVWIKRVLEEIYQGDFRQEQYEGYLGIVQQYMFYYMRHRSV
jgi:N-glycosylase/DNA lyase